MPSSALRALRALIAAAGKAPQNQQATNLQKRCCINFPGARAWKVGVGEMPTYNGSEAGQLHYYQGTIQTLLESLELCLDLGLELPTTQRTEFDTNELLRLDTATRFDAYSKAIGSGWMAPNEARKREGLAPVAGGDTPYLQVQNYSLAALQKRDQTEATMPQ